MHKQIQIGNKDFIFSTGKLAKQADGAVTVQCGDTIVLVTACGSTKPREGIDFFPLSVDYREKTSAVGRFPGGYIKRETRPSEKEILTARLTDRPIRPLFPEGFLSEVQVMADVLSADDNNPDILAINGASAALTISDVPFLGPIGAVRMGRINDEFVVNPTTSQAEESTLDLVIAGNSEAIMMIEGHSKGVTEDIVLESIKIAQEHIKKLIEAQLALQKEVGKPKREVVLVTIDESLYSKVKEKIGTDLNKAIQITDKQKRQKEISSIKEKVLAELIEELPEEPEKSFTKILSKIEKETARNLALNEGKRYDGRKMDEIRPIACEIGLLPRTHGSALFTRGETQSLATTTLGTNRDAQRGENLAGEFSKKFMLHYNFPPFSVGEIRPIRGAGRREIGHGILAERSLSAILPNEEEFPYTIRIVSDILESNGSSSMASVCAGSLSLMDAGVPIKENVAGIAMGLMINDKKSLVISDILGSEDACGDMDFKIAGTRTVIHAIQLDVKYKKGLNPSILKEGLEQARLGRLHILDIMEKVIKTPKAQLSEYAPKIASIQIPPEKIGIVIGPGGKTIKKIVEETGANIEIEDSGIVKISSLDQEAIDKATDIVKLLTHDVVVGDIYEGTVRNIMDFGAFVELVPGKDGLIHVSELANTFIKNVEDVVKVGDKVRVKVIKVDDKGRISLSKKQLEEQKPDSESK